MEESSTKLLLVLDLDETLIHATNKPLAYPAEHGYLDYHIYQRPHLHEFLRSMQPLCDLAIWSSADDEYVTAVVDRIKPADVEFRYVWGRSRCTTRRHFDLDKYVREKHLKKLKKKGHPLERIIMVDDSPEKTRENYGNAIYISSFEGDPNDRELLLLATYLQSIPADANVRKLEKRGWRNWVINHS